MNRKLIALPLVIVLFAMLVGSLAARPLAAPNFGSPNFQWVWQRTDQMVASGTVARSWYWGPAPNTEGLWEDYAEGINGQRRVQYFDKSRMEINQPGGDPNNKFYVTNGLLTNEMIKGQMQTGNNSYSNNIPPHIPLASDGNDPSAPTYATFACYANLSMTSTKLTGSNPIHYATATVSRSGITGSDPTRQGDATRFVHFETATQHNIPQVFWQFLNQPGLVSGGGTEQLNDPWFYATGYPITEPYWAQVKIGGVGGTQVMFQLYERRVLTYVPSETNVNFRVQMGNIGQHYYGWRYSGQGREAACFVAQDGGTGTVQGAGPGSDRTPFRLQQPGTDTQHPVPALRPIFEREAATKINYTVTSSRGAKALLLARQVDFAASYLPFTAQERQQAGGRVQQAITALDAVVFVAGARVDPTGRGLLLTNKLLIAIYSGQITRWNDPQLVQLNPQLAAVDAQIDLLHNTATEQPALLDSYFLKTLGVKFNFQFGKQLGSDAEVERLLNNESIYGLGYVRYNNITGRLPVVSLENRVGKFVAASPQALRAAAENYSPTDPNADLLAVPRADAYPLTAASWLLALNEQPTFAKGIDILNLFWWYQSRGLDEIASRDLGVRPPSSAIFNTWQNLAGELTGEEKPIYQQGLIPPLEKPVPAPIQPTPLLHLHRPLTRCRPSTATCESSRR